ncbi:MAG: glycosyltransferase family 39 protein [Anaerolineae bacterium]|nr:glycosyltransferase family 39 protein [Anaerolineae bacterium]
MSATSASASRARYIFAAALVLLFAAWIRVYSLDAESLWMDEAFSVWAATRGALADVVHAAAGDVHPPFYFMLLKGWTLLAGDTEFAGRLLSVGCGLLTIAFSYRAACEMFTPAAGLLAALVAAASSYQMYYARELRMYTLAPMLGAAAIFFYRRWLCGGARRMNAVGLWAALTLLLYTHYFGAFVPLVIALHYWLVLPEQRRKLPGFLLIYLGTAAAFVPWLPVLVMQIVARPGGLDQAIPTSPDLMRHLLAVFTDAQPVLYAGLIGLALLTARAASPPGDQTRVRVSRRKGAGVCIAPEAPASLKPISWTALLALWAFVPLAVTLYVNRYVPVFTVQNLTIAAPPVAMLAGVGLSRLRRGAPRIIFAALALLSGLGVSYDLYQGKPDWRGFVDAIAAQHRPGDVMFLHIGGPPLWNMPFEYYYMRRVPGAAPPVDLFQVQGPPSAQVFAAALDRLTGAGRPWVVFTHTTPVTDYALPLFQKMGTDAPRTPLLVGALDDHRAYLYDDDYDDAPGAAPEFHFYTPDGVRFRLTGYALAPGPYRPGGVIDVTLTWEVDAPPSANYSMGVYLLSENAGPAADHLGFPGGVPTSEWRPGQAYTDPHQLVLPGDLPTGYYNVTVRVRNVFKPDAAPLRVTDQPGTPLGEYLALGGVTLELDTTAP